MAPRGATENRAFGSEGASLTGCLSPMEGRRVPSGPTRVCLTCGSTCEAPDSGFQSGLNARFRIVARPSVIEGTLATAAGRVKGPEHMILRTRAALLLSGLALVASPAAAFASGPPSDPGSPDNQGTQRAAANKPTSSAEPGPGASLPVKAKAYGRFCQDQSKQHVAGQKGTAFSQCVTAMAKLATSSTSSPRAACATMSKQHVAGQKGTPFSSCIGAGAKLIKDQHKNP
jgi:hypothetical protein